jgi:hypothetical protein
MTNDAALRDHLRRLLAWEDAHVGFDTAVDGIPAALRGRQPPGLPHSPWQILEHVRIAQHDILDFCRNQDYQEMKWPDDYWPASPEPPSAAAWDESLRAYRADVEALRRLAADSAVDLGARIPHGDGQTYLRELLVVADHTAYHLGELVAVRRLLGAWK